MLPLIIGIGVTVAALTTKATMSTILKCRTLTNVEILRMNGIFVKTQGGRRNPLDEIMLQGGFQSEMDRLEAIMILGFGPEDDLNEKTVKSRYRKMMMLNHPDQGGSPMIAMKINKAKEILEKGL